jgi:NAD-dependent dihydropyrimidine dehydrogenase PreA subunit
MHRLRRLRCGVPTEAISEGAIYVIDADKCIDCGNCADVCPVGAPKAE